MISGDDRVWVKAVKDAALPPFMELNANAFVVVCKWLQTEHIDVMAETEHTLIARVKAACR